MSNKTPKGNDAKTASAHKLQKRIIVSITIFIFVASYVGLLYLSRQDTQRTGNNTLYCLNSSNTKPNVLGCAVQLEPAISEVERERGLSGRQSLNADSGMVFLFDQPAQQCFWMKGMKFNIDIVWLDSDKKVVQVLSNVAPDTYPKSFCANDTKYVIELSPHKSDELGLRPGTQADIQL